MLPSIFHAMLLIINSFDSGFVDVLNQLTKAGDVTHESFMGIEVTLTKYLQSSACLINCSLIQKGSMP